MTRSASMEKDWFLNKIQELIRALAGIAEYHNTLPYYRNEDDHGQPTREALLSQYLAEAVYRATNILAHAAEAEWKTSDGESILRHGQAGVRQLLKRYGLPLPWEQPLGSAFTMPQITIPALGLLEGLPEDLTFATFNTARPLHGPVTWDNRVIEENQQRELLTQALDQIYNYALHPQGWLLIAGPYGVGKTHLATAIIWEALKRGMTPLYVSALDMAGRFRSLDNPEWLREQPRLETADLLVLDTLCLEYRLIWNGSTEQLLRTRHRYQRPTVLVSTRGTENLPAWLSNIVTEISVVASDYRHLRKHP